MLGAEPRGGPRGDGDGGPGRAHACTSRWSRSTTSSGAPSRCRSRCSAAWLYLTEPGRGTLALMVPFLAVGSLAYPLLAPFTLAFIAFSAALIWRRRAPGRAPGWVAALRLPRGKGWLALGAALAAVAVPVAVVLSLAAADKVVDGVRAALPGGDLGPWSGERARLPAAVAGRGRVRAARALAGAPGARRPSRWCGARARWLCRWQRPRSAAAGRRRLHAPAHGRRAVRVQGAGASAA